jgi:hypothetical protein
MTTMKRLLLLFGLAGALLPAADLANVRKVYVMSMRSGLDQYLANRITNQKVFLVVVDPKLADAVLTDRLGNALQASLEEISPSPEKAQPVEPPKPPEKAPAGDDAPRATPAFSGETVNRLQDVSQNSSFGRAKGTIFLVDAVSREVLWSTFQLSSGTRAATLDDTATEIAGHLKQDLSRSRKAQQKAAHPGQGFHFWRKTSVKRASPPAAPAPPPAPEAETQPAAAPAEPAK